MNASQRLEYMIQWLRGLVGLQPTDPFFVPETRTINGQSLSADVVIATGAISSSMAVADSAARYALTSLVNGQLVQQADGTRWECADASQGASNAGWWQLPDAPPPPFATYVSDVSGWSIDGGCSFVLTGSDVTITGDKTAVTNIQAAPGCAADTVFSLGQVPAIFSINFGVYGGGTSPLVTTPDFSGNTALITLDLRYTSITSPPNVSALLSLQQLLLDGLALTTAPGFSTNSVLTYLDISSAALVAVDQIFLDLDASGASTGYCNVAYGTNAAPTSASAAARASLLVKGWMIITN